MIKRAKILYKILLEFENNRIQSFWKVIGATLRNKSVKISPNTYSW